MNVWYLSEIGAHDIFVGGKKLVSVAMNTLNQKIMKLERKNSHSFSVFVSWPSLCFRVIKRRAVRMKQYYRVESMVLLIRNMCVSTG